MTGLLYAVGTAVGVLILALAGRRLLSRLRSNAGRLQMALGVVMVAFAVLTLTGADDRFRTEIASALPSWLVSPTDSLGRKKPRVPTSRTAGSRRRSWGRRSGSTRSR